MVGGLIALFLALQTLGFAGGGSSSSDYGGGSSDWGSGGSSSWSSSSDYSSSSDRSRRSGFKVNDSIIALISAGTALAFVVIIAFVLIKGVREKNKPLDVNTLSQKANLSEAVSKMDQNSTDLEKWAHKEAERIFVTYQNDWSNNNLRSIKTYTTDSYYQHACLLLEAIKRMGRQNKVSGLNVVKVSLLSTLDGTEALPTKIAVQFKFSGLDELIEIDSGKVLYSDRAYGIYETWMFEYDGRGLKLDGIKQPTASLEHLGKSMEEFAKENGLFYSADWGRYALPMRGAIFNGANFDFSDVNNHVIGKWGDALIQLYTYAMSPNTPDTYYLVGQISVPKKYERILVKSRFMNDSSCVVPEGCEEVTMEWQEFNDRYQVYTSKKDALPTFELLNPQFMANLYDRGLNYSLEVVDNVIYIFARIGETKESDYRELLDILALAYKELKL